jgi:protein-S-isoprenylcysteine O-methyltransferase Ste14
LTGAQPSGYLRFVPTPYSWFAYLGLMVVAAALLFGFRHAPDAPAINFVFDGALFMLYMAVHYVMLTPAWKRLVTGRERGSMAERRVYIAVAVLSWVGLYAVHRPLPGPAYALPAWVTYFGICCFLLSFLAFLEGATFERLAGLLGIPGAEQAWSAAADTPLMTQGSYASVRHPMYRGATFMCLSSVLVHPNAAQLVWAIGVALTFVLFIPIEERQLLRTRGEEYRAYMQITRYRLLRGLW